MRKIIITMGDPRGIGPEIICKSLLLDDVTQGANFILIGDESVFQEIPQYEKIAAFRNVSLLDIGKSAKDKSETAWLSLKKAISLIKDKQAEALVTGPISKQNMRTSGFSFNGHTDYLCHEFHVKKHAMMLFHDTLRVVLLTTHLPLNQIFSHVTEENILEKLELTAQSLIRDFKIMSPRIAVCGLNPHAGENGMFGREELEIILPTMEKFKKQRGQAKLFGPLSPDTVFYQAMQGQFDAVLCHYHDQGLIAVKSTGFDRAVNMTLGLPFVRTSPDHGTAFDIAGKGIADASSMVAAIQAAKRCGHLFGGSDD